MLSTTNSVSCGPIRACSSRSSSSNSSSRRVRPAVSRISTSIADFFATSTACSAIRSGAASLSVGTKLASTCSARRCSCSIAAGRRVSRLASATLRDCVFLKVQRQLARGCGLARALQAGEQNDDRGLMPQFQPRFAVGQTQRRGQLVVKNLDERLPRAQAARDFRTDRTLAHAARRNRARPAARHPPRSARGARPEPRRLRFPRSGVPCRARARQQPSVSNSDCRTLRFPENSARLARATTSHFTRNRAFRER